MQAEPAAVRIIHDEIDTISEAEYREARTRYRARLAWIWAVLEAGNYVGPNPFLPPPPTPPKGRVRRRKGLHIVPAGLRRERPDSRALLAIHNKCEAMGGQLARRLRTLERIGRVEPAPRPARLPVVA